MAHNNRGKIRVSLKKIHLVDKCLLMLMIVLLTQSTYVLLTNGGQVDEAAHIDIIIRTASASIFGYFLSGNFVQSADVTVNPKQSDKHQNRIGKMQIITATAIAMFCLIALIGVRDVAGAVGTIDPSAAAVVAQFRDFVSGCIGFLIGCPTPKSDDKN